MSRTKAKEDARNLVLIEGWWYLRAMVAGKKIKQSLHTQSLVQAREKRDELLRSVLGIREKKQLLNAVEVQLLGMEEIKKREEKSSFMGFLLGAVWVKFVRCPTRREMKARSLGNYERSWRNFIGWMMKNYPHIQYTRQVTHLMGIEWAEHIRDTMESSETSRKAFVCVRAIWNAVQDWDEETNNPLRRIPSQLKKDNSRRKEPFSDEDMRKIFSKENDRDFRVISGFMFYLALRWDTASHVRWSQIRDGYFEGLHGKTGADATTRLPSQLLELLGEYREDERNGYIFKRYAAPRSNDIYMRELRALGIETNERDENGRMRCVKGAHSFRHRAITDALINGNSVAAVKRLAGHATEAMQRHYTHMDADVAGNTAESLGKFW